VLDSVMNSMWTLEMAYSCRRCRRRRWESLLPREGTPGLERDRFAIAATAPIHFNSRNARLRRAGMSEWERGCGKVEGLDRDVPNTPTP
jgi:hypothetical protein